MTMNEHYKTGQIKGGPLPEKKPDNRSKVQILLDGLAAGECKGVGGAKAYKIAEYAKEKGLV